MNSGAASSQTQASVDRQHVSAETVEACRQGDHAAFHQLYESCHISVYGLMVRMVGYEDAADLTQQVFLQVFRTIGQFAGRARIETWIYRVAVNEALQHLRRTGARKVQTLDHDPADGAVAPQPRLEQKDLLDQALARIDPELRSLFLLREVEGLSYSELADAAVIPEGTVGSRLNRARRELKQHLTDLGWEA